LTILLCSACIVLPVPVEPKIEPVNDVEIPDEMLVSLGPGNLLDALTKKLVKNNPDIEVVDALTFRDTAFPDGGWRLKDLLDPIVAAQVADMTNVIHLALVSVRNLNEWDEDFSVMVPLAFGALSGEEKSVMSVMIFDLRQPQAVAKSVVTAIGHTRGAYLVVYGLFFDPMTVAGVENGVVEAIAQAVTSEAGDKPVRIALLAAEGIADDPDLVGDGHFPESRRDNQLSYEDDEGD